MYFRPQLKSQRAIAPPPPPTAAAASVAAAETAYETRHCAFEPLFYSNNCVNFMHSMTHTSHPLNLKSGSLSSEKCPKLMPEVLKTFSSPETPLPFSAL
ncbi:hypothetical protein T02_9584 [Trichinella nativa]|uniref:Uncharacterized protein n=1 Tax=Trichinella nativa TaxID=6335 RepID=A0A0V1KYD4_9BILA|nr:hypothetical protein T02_9584 [Trichinella nativa]